MMRLSYCSLALLVWLPVILNAQGTPELCSAPTLQNAYWVPMKNSYQQHEKIMYVCENGYKHAVEGCWAESVCRDGQWSPQPLCIVYSPESEDGNTKPAFVPVENCGEFPIVENGLVEKSEPLALRVRCQHYYECHGPDKVVCYNSNKWSVIPTCKANFCSVNTDDYSDLIPAGVKFMTNGEKMELECKNLFYFKSFRVVRCINGKATVSRCCNRFQINTSC